ncbi:MAG: right-handed parallel beta-helix repeat-containing protein [Planctomycetota bacterium]|nr:right-handed parallel beta-helix repeat-containing protein [Planctomycetota bacterium]
MGCFIPAILIIFTLVVSSVAALADMLRVPEDYPTIQAASDASNFGDVIDLGPGTWNQQVWGLSGVTLRGRDGAAATIIDGTGLEWSPVVCYGSPCVIEDLTFRHGVGSNIFGIIRGGAIYTEFVQLTVNRCRFEDNSVSVGKFSDAIGGAICSYYGSLEVSNCDFVDNAANSGGGIYSTYASSALIRNCTFQGHMGWEGGAVHLHMTPFTIEQCLFIDNVVGWQGGGICVDAMDADGMGLQGQVINSTFRRNKGSDYGYGQGGGINVLGHQDVEIEGCHFQDNYAYTGGGIYGGYLAGAPGPIPVSGTSFCGNFFHDYSYKGIEDIGGNTFEQSCWCSADIDLDGVVGVNDLLTMLAVWGDYYYPDYDTNNDGLFDVNDLLTLIEAWDRECDDNS